MTIQHSVLSRCLVAAGAALASAAATLAQPVPVVVQPGFKVAPFSGFWAGGPKFGNPNFGVIADQASVGHPPMMFVSELAPWAAQVSMVSPTGVNVPYTVPIFPSGAAGIDIDGITGSNPAPTMGIYGGPIMMYVGQDPIVGPGVLQVMPGGPWGFFAPPLCFPGYSALTIDRTPGFQYGGFMYTTDWGGDQTDAILHFLPSGAPVPLVALPGFDPRHLAFDLTGGLTGYGPGQLWTASFTTGVVMSVLPNGAITPPLATLPMGLEGLAFAHGDGCFGSALYVSNGLTGTIDVVKPNGAVMPFAAGFPSAVGMLFVTQGPFALNGKPALYVLDGIDTVWVITPTPTPTPADLNGDANVDAADLAILLGAWGPCTSFPCPADLDLDGMVGGSDLAILLGSWGTCWRC